MIGGWGPQALQNRLFRAVWAAGCLLGAGTAGELAGLFTDLPRRPAAVTGTAPAPARPGSFRAARMPAPIAIIAIVVLASILSGHPGLIALVPVLVFLAIRRLAGGRGRLAPR